MLIGAVVAFGKKALTISTKDGNQFYAPAVELSPLVIDKLRWPVERFLVSFQVDKTRLCGETLSGPRYYARYVMTIKNNEEKMWAIDT